MKSAAQHLLDRVEEMAVTIHNLRRDLKAIDKQYHALINLRRPAEGDACFRTADDNLFFAKPPYMPTHVGDRVALPILPKVKPSIKDCQVDSTFVVHQRMYEYRGWNYKIGGVETEISILEEVFKP